MGQPSGPGRAPRLVQMTFFHGVQQIFSGLLLLSALFSADILVSAQYNNEIALVALNGSYMNCLGQASITPKIVRANQAACLTPFPCINSSETPPPIAGQCSFNGPINFSPTKSFSTMFSFNTLKFPTFSVGEGFAFFLSSIQPTAETIGDSGGYLGWLNSSTDGDQSGHNFAVEFDLVQNFTGFNDPNYPHIGINKNSLNSSYVSEVDSNNLATLSSAAKVYVWIHYDGAKELIDVRINQEARKPCKPTISKSLDLSSLLADQMYVGFTSSTGGVFLGPGYNNTYNTQTTVFDLSFSASDQAPNIYGDDEQCGLKVSLTVVLGIVIGVLCLMLLLLLGLVLWRSRRVSDLEKEKSELIAELKGLDYGARQFTYQEIVEATRAFQQEIGKGGFGKVYKGDLSNIVTKGSRHPSTAVAVKRINRTDDLDDAKQLVAEVKVIGRLRHVNIVPLLGWCHEQKQMVLVYKFMENGDVDQHLFPSDYSDIGHKNDLTWAKRMGILRGVAAALKFLHEDFESDQTVIHRDVKTRNVMIDRDFNARLGDFGLARFCDRGSESHYQTQELVGTRGYIAPEYEMGATVETDVYSFGVMTLVVATGRKPLEKSVSMHKGQLVGWVRTLYDESLYGSTEDPIGAMYSTDRTFDRAELERTLKVGLFCCAFEPTERPLMRAVVAALEGASPIFSTAMPAQGSQRQQLESFYSLDDDDDATQPLEEDFHTATITERANIQMTRRLSHKKIDIE